MRESIVFKTFIFWGILNSVLYYFLKNTEYFSTQNIFLFSTFVSLIFWACKSNKEEKKLIKNIKIGDKIYKYRLDDCSIVHFEEKMTTYTVKKMKGCRLLIENNLTKHLKEISIWDLCDCYKDSNLKDF